jgi:hypothetical protein
VAADGKLARHLEHGEPLVTAELGKPNRPRAVAEIVAGHALDPWQGNRGGVAWVARWVRGCISLHRKGVAAVGPGGPGRGSGRPRALRCDGLPPDVVQARGGRSGVASPKQVEPDEVAEVRPHRLADELGES